MKRNSRPESAAPGKIAFLWDESFLWGLMSYKALCAGGLSFDLLRSDDIRRGLLKNYSMFFVPGGWASNKLKALGADGAAEIRRFVESGGSYLGFCGGAGLATMDGIGLLRVKRKPTKERVPSFSGRIRLDLGEHPIWKGIPGSRKRRQAARSSGLFYAWWPSQFVIEEESIKVLATYGEALRDAFSSDLNVGDTAANGGWDELEKMYGINLDPQRLYGEPALVEGVCGSGRVILSLIHFDTPSDNNGADVLKNLWAYLADQKAGSSPFSGLAGSAGGRGDITEEIGTEVFELEKMAKDLVLLGMRNFLWFWRNPMLLQWRRGVRGLEYCTLYIMLKEISEIIRSEKYHLPCGEDFSRLREGLSAIRKFLVPFADDSKRLLIRERLAMQKGHITYDRCEDREVSKIRRELFSDSKSHGGLFKHLIDAIDETLFAIIGRRDI